jgi:4a-hydroxytetrahydrobiopterin dehydratase
MARLDDAEIAAALQQLPGWWREGEVLVRTYRRRDWADAVAFVNTIAPEADRRNHHPDVCITGYRSVTIRLTSHDEGGITKRDVNLATWIEAAAAG